MTWQCRRSTPLCHRLAEQNLGSVIHNRTGLQLDPGFSAGKISWLLDSVPDGYNRADAGELCAGTIDSWLLYNLTGGKIHACDVTNASRTQLLNIHTLQWDAGSTGIILMYLKPPCHTVAPSGHIFGQTIACGNLPGGIPITCMIGDSHGALYGHAGFAPGTVKATYGTGSSLMTTIDKPQISSKGISTTVAWGKKEINDICAGRKYLCNRCSRTVVR